MMNIKKFPRGDKTQLSANFSVSEFECACGICPETLINLDHVAKLQKLRDDMNAPIHINSAYRCPTHNKAIGGELHSQHMIGNATDIKIEGMTPLEVQDACESRFDGLGRYDVFTHIDSRGVRARWDFRKKKPIPSGNSSVDGVDKDL
jgi:hypothetical protein